jgi:hypothetical protein
MTNSSNEGIPHQEDVVVIQKVGSVSWLWREGGDSMGLDVVGVCG